MLKKLKVLSVGFGLALASLSADSVLIGDTYKTVIHDNYIGGHATNSNYDGLDVIGNPDVFNTTKMVVKHKINTTQVKVDIFSTFIDDVGTGNTGGVVMGDLFISNDGWNPYGDAPYLNDDASNGEDWEYALRLDDHNTQDGGSIDLYRITSDDDILLSDDVYGQINPNGIYRGGQEVQVNTDSAQLVGTVGSWNINTNKNRLRFNFDYQSILDETSQLTGFGLHWGFTCANDVIEGYAPVYSAVPEPTTLALMGLGLGGIALARRKKKAA